jgi:hypothetical protein
MAYLVYDEFKRANAAAEIDLNADDIRARLVMSNTTCDTENTSITNISDFTTVDKCDSGGYADEALTTEAVNLDDANDRAEFDADDVTWSSLATCTRDVPGVLIYKYVDGTDANDIPIAYLGFASAKTPDGSDFTIQWDAQGILQLA